VKKSELFRPKVAAKPDNLLFRFSLGQALYDEGEPAEAIEHLQLCCESREDWMLPRILLGKALLQTGKEELARPILKDALALAIDQHHEGPEEELRQILNED
jgi:Flp pilus assembly protein TadD